jgi:deoxyadenosine/deoxycytidine kinase
VLTHNLTPPSLLVHLSASVKTLQERINGRARPSELAIPADYLLQLNRRYEEWLRRFELCPVLRIETDELDFAHDPAARREVVELIAQAVGERGVVQERFMT